MIACVGSMILLYQEVKQTLQRASLYAETYGARQSLGRSGNNSNKVAVQAFLYSFTFLITWMPSTLWSIAHWFRWSHFALDMAAATAEPLQGFWNFLIFLRSRPETRRKLQVLLSIILPCCCSSPSPDQGSSALRSSRSSDYNVARGDPIDEDASSLLRSIRSVKRRLRVLAGSLSLGGSSDLIISSAQHNDKEDGSNCVDDVPNFGQAQDNGDNTRTNSDLCIEEKDSGESRKLSTVSSSTDCRATTASPLDTYRTKEEMKNETTDATADTKEFGDTVD